MSLLNLSSSANIKAVFTPILIDNKEEEIIITQDSSRLETIMSSTDIPSVILSSVSNAGDVNDDGIDDIIVGAPNVNLNGREYVGQSYVIFGNPNINNSDHFDLKSLDGNNGFAIEGTKEGDFAGTSASNAGDINDDGIDDIIVGAPGVNSNGKEFAGETYVIFGSPQIGGDGSHELSQLNGSNGFAIKGIDENDNAGYSASNVGDVNNDGIDDIILSRPEADINGRENVGQSHVIFGNPNLSNAGDFDLNSLDGSNGFTLNGVNAEDRAGSFVSNAGDVNNDGIDDIILGAPGIKRDKSKESYVVFGSPQIGANGSLELSNLDGSNGFAIKGDNSIYSASEAGDVNNDGIDDIILGAPGASSDEGARGKNYVIFGNTQIGNSGSLNLSQLNGKDGFEFGCAQKLSSSESGSLTYIPLPVCGNSVSSAGDINNDGIDDLIIGAENGAKSYAIFGNSDLGSSELSPLDGSKGFTIQGDKFDSIGYSVSNAGDIDDDGIDDIIIRASSPEAGNYSYLIFGGRQSIMTISDSEDEIPKPEIQALNLMENHSATIITSILFTSLLFFSAIKKAYSA